MKNYCVLPQDLQYILIQVIGKHAMVITMVLLSLFFLVLAAISNTRAGINR